MTEPITDDRPVSIYGLTDPDGRVRYVGRSVNPETRFEHHRTNGNPAVCAWFRELATRGETPRLQIFELVDARGDSAARERELIAYYESVEGSLLNAQLTTKWQAGRPRSKPTNRGAEALVALGLSQVYVASILGIGQSQVCLWMKGVRAPSSKLRAAIEDLFGIGWRTWDDDSVAAKGAA